MVSYTYTLHVILHKCEIYFYVPYNCYILCAYMHYNALLTWVEIQDYMHINFKTCKTMLEYFLYSKKKKVMETINTQFRQGWGGGKATKKGKAIMCLQSLTLHAGWWVRGCGYVLSSLSKLLKIHEHEWTKAEKRSPGVYLACGRGKLHGRGCLCEVHLEFLHLLKKRGQRLPNCLPPSDALGWGWAREWKGQEQGRPCDTPRVQTTEQGLRNQTLCVRVCM